MLSLLSAGLLDEMRIYLDPVVVGPGLRLFDNDQSMNFELVETRPLPLGVTYLVYRPVSVQ